jgi:hypothetical protein
LCEDTIATDVNLETSGRVKTENCEFLITTGRTSKGAGFRIASWMTDEDYVQFRNEGLLHGDGCAMVLKSDLWPLESPNP